MLMLQINVSMTLQNSFYIDVFTPREIEFAFRF